MEYWRRKEERTEGGSKNAKMSSGLISVFAPYAHHICYVEEILQTKSHCC